MTCHCGYPDLPGSCPGPALCPMHGEGQQEPDDRCVDCGAEGQCMPGCPSRLVEASDAEMLASVSPDDLAEAHRIRRAALDWAADAIREQDGGNIETETGWESDEALAHWLTIREMLNDPQ